MNKSKGMSVEIPRLVGGYLKDNPNISVRLFKGRHPRGRLGCYSWGFSGKKDVERVSLYHGCDGIIGKFVLFHELVHSTGVVKRLARLSLARYSDNCLFRAEEEIVADVGALILLCVNKRNINFVRGVVFDNLVYAKAKLSSKRWNSAGFDGYRAAVLLGGVGAANLGLDRFLGVLGEFEYDFKWASDFSGMPFENI